MFCPCVATSQISTDQKLLRFDLTPLVGYRTSMSFPTSDTANSSSPHVILDASPSYGISFGVRLDEENLIEFRWARQDTHVHLENAQFPNSSAVLNQFHGDFTHEYFIDQWPPWVRPFIMGSVCATHVGGAANSSFNRFSFGLGTGIKVFPTRHVGFRVQGEWLPVVVNPQVNAFICGGGCIVRLSGTLVSQGEIAIGPEFRF